ncbi:MAG: hypothetical protein JWO48_636, partial [Bryobacterales bacterium]|nr:hypothetical protein [Bryobacterales bacterium]
MSVELRLAPGNVGPDFAGVLRFYKS